MPSEPLEKIVQNRTAKLFNEFIKKPPEKQGCIVANPFFLRKTTQNKHKTYQKQHKTKNILKKTIDNLTYVFYNIFE